MNSPAESRGPKAAGIFLRIWSCVDPKHVALGNRALALLPRISGRHSGASPGFKTINIRPLILNGAGISDVAAKCSSVRGIISSAWTTKASGITLDVTIPANTTATIHVPGTDPLQGYRVRSCSPRARPVTYGSSTLDAIKNTAAGLALLFNTGIGILDSHGPAAQHRPVAGANETRRAGRLGQSCSSQGRDSSCAYVAGSRLI